MKKLILLAVPFFLGAYLFKIVEESGSILESKDSRFWVSSGAYFRVVAGEASTLHGELPLDNRWRKLYGKNNPIDTDNGLHPQNIFRLIYKKRMQSLSEQFSFYVSKTNLSASENRNESNGVLAFLRYQDENNLYYAGVRVDGRPIIKKKIGGSYFNMSYPPQIFAGTYDRAFSPNLIPAQQWISLRASVSSDPGCPARISLSVSTDSSWKEATSACDSGQISGPPFLDGLSGIRTDFMDIRFRGLKIEPR